MINNGLTELERKNKKKSNLTTFTPNQIKNIKIN